MKTENDNSPETRFKILVNIYRFVGIPLFMPGVPNIFYAHSVLMILSAYGTWLGVFGDIIHNYDDFNHLSESVRAFVPMTCAVACDAFFRLRRKRLERIMKLTECFTWNDIPKRDPLTGHRTMAAFIPVILSVILYLTVSGLLLHSVYCIFRLSMQEDHILTLNAVYPFNHVVSPVYELTNLSQYVAAFSYAFNYYGFGGFFATMVAVSCSQFEKLKMSMMKLRERNLQECTTESKEEQKNRTENMKQQLEMFIHNHQKLIRFVRELEKTTSELILLLFTMISLGLCFSVFSTVVKLGDLHHRIQELILSSANLTVLFCLCWFGTQLTQQNITDCVAGKTTFMSNYHVNFLWASGELIICPGYQGTPNVIQPEYNARGQFSLGDTPLKLQTKTQDLYGVEELRDAVWNCGWVGAPIPIQRNIAFIIAMTSKEFILTAGSVSTVTLTTSHSIVQQSYSFLMFMLNMHREEKQ